MARDLEGEYQRRKLQTNAVENLVGKLDRWGQERRTARERAFLQGDAREATPSPAEQAQELAELRAQMADDASPYWRGRDAASLQLRYRALLEGKGD